MIFKQQFSVRVSAVSLLCPAGQNEDALLSKDFGRINNFKARRMVPDRKNIKLMTRAVQLGVACIADAVSKVSNWDQIPPERRGVYVGASPQVGRHEDLEYAIEAAYSSGEFSLKDFAQLGIDKIHPLWLIRGLSNNILGFSSAYHDIQGQNMNYSMGEDGGWNAIIEAINALQDNRVDIVVAGGADDLTGAEQILDGVCSEAAAFLIFERGEDIFTLDPKSLAEEVSHFGNLGSAKWPVAIALKELAKVSAKE